MSGTPENISREVIQLDRLPFAGGNGSLFKGQYGSSREQRCDVIVRRISTVDCIGKRAQKVVRALLDVAHLNVISFVGFSRAGQEIWILAPFHPWGNVRQYIVGHDATIERKLDLLLDVTSGLKYLHEHLRRIVHGSLKAENVLMDLSGKAMLCDFGISRLQEEADRKRLRSGLAGNVASHTLWYSRARYHSPELRSVAAGHTFTPTLQSDLWTWGCLSVEILSVPLFNFFKDIPHPTKTYLVIKAKTLIRSLDIPLKENLQTLFQSCWNEEPDKRPRIDIAWFTIAGIRTQVGRTPSPQPVSIVRPPLVPVSIRRVRSLSEPTRPTLSGPTYQTESDSDVPSVIMNPYTDFVHLDHTDAGTGGTTLGESPHSRREAEEHLESPLLPSDSSPQSSSSRAPSEAGRQSNATISAITSPSVIAGKGDLHTALDSSSFIESPSLLEPEFPIFPTSHHKPETLQVPSPFPHRYAPVARSEDGQYVNMPTTPRELSLSHHSPSSAEVATRPSLQVSTALPELYTSEPYTTDAPKSLAIPQHNAVTGPPPPIPPRSPLRVLASRGQSPDTGSMVDALDDVPRLDSVDRLESSPTSLLAPTIPPNVPTADVSASIAVTSHYQPEVEVSLPPHQLHSAPLDVEARLPDAVVATCAPGRPSFESRIRSDSEPSGTTTDSRALSVGSHRTQPRPNLANLDGPHPVYDTREKYPSPSGLECLSASSEHSKHQTSTKTKHESSVQIQQLSPGGKSQNVPGFWKRLMRRCRRLLCCGN